MSHHHHNHTHGMDAASRDASLSRAFTIGIVLNLIFVAVEFGAGFVLNSVALMSDAGHNLSDVVSLALSLMAFRLAKLSPNEKYTYGRQKSTVLVSLANAFILLIAIAFIVLESIEKFMHPAPVQGGAIAWVAGVGIVINAFTAWLFLRHKNNDLNVKGAYLHMAADTLVSVGVLISGIIISVTGWYIIDPIIGIVIAVVILFSTWNLLHDSIRLSLDGVPVQIDMENVKAAILGSDPSVVDVHHIHIWALSTTENALTAHILLSGSADNCAVREKIKNELAELGIGHVTLEVEYPGDPGSGSCNCCG